MRNNYNTIKEKKTCILKTVLKGGIEIKFRMPEEGSKVVWS